MTTHWRSLKDSMPPTGEEVLLFDPAKNGADPLIWMAWTAPNGMVEFSLTWQYVMEYEQKENEEWMRERLKSCTHWAKVWDVITPPAGDSCPT